MNNNNQFKINSSIYLKINEKDISSTLVECELIFT
jgi:hypothetical protein